MDDIKIREKINNAKPTRWPAEDLSDEEATKIVEDAKKKANEYKLHGGFVGTSHILSYDYLYNHILDIKKELDSARASDTHIKSAQNIVDTIINQHDDMIGEIERLQHSLF